MRGIGWGPKGRSRRGPGWESEFKTKLSLRGIKLVDVYKVYYRDTGVLELHMVWRTEDTSRRDNEVLNALEQLFGIQLTCIRGRSICICKGTRCGWEHSARFDSM